MGPLRTGPLGTGPLGTGPRVHESRAGLARRDGQVRAVTRLLPDEVPVALSYQGTTQAVMMASPADLEDFAVGFTLSEGIVAEIGQIESLDILHHDQGIEAQMWLAGDRADALSARRRAMVGPVGCGLCGIDSLEEACRALPVVPDAALRFTEAEIGGATEALRDHQPLHDLSRGLHAAGLMLPGQGIVLAREDVGRHNALDKLIGAMARRGLDGRGGAVVLTSRVSMEMVQKTAMAGVPMIIAVSAPTAYAARLAEEAGITLAAFARGGAYDLYANAGRLGAARPGPEGEHTDVA